MSEQATGLTRRQLGVYWRTVGAACAELGLRGRGQIEEYRKRVLREEACKESVKELGRTEEFDRVMRRMCVDAGMYEKAVAYSDGDYGRMRHHICGAVREIVGPRGNVEAYAEACARRVGVVVARGCRWDWSDCTLEQLRKILAMCRIQVARIRKRLNTKTGENVNSAAAILTPGK